MISEHEGQSGFLPVHSCKACGVSLGKPGYPAELYLGTYNGLCYKCTNSSGHVECVYTLDGAMRVNYPPHCPSWRRDREIRTAYADCPDCSGRGEFYTPKPLYSGGAYYRYCQTCAARYDSHPRRVEYWRRREKLQKDTYSYYASLVNIFLVYLLLHREDRYWHTRAFAVCRLLVQKYYVVLKEYIQNLDEEFSDIHDKIEYEFGERPHPRRRG